MPSLYRISQTVWRAIVPLSLRETRLARGVKRLYNRTVPHNVVYDSEYFEREVESGAALSAEAIAGSILSDLKPSTAVDVGCGTGALLAALKAHGCRVLGLEYSDSGLEYCRNRGLDVRKFDIERAALDDDPTFDVAITMEVAEHLPESCADRFVSLLTALSDQIVFTAATPGQGGTDHINEQPASYWLAKFLDRGFTPDYELAARWKRDWEATRQVSVYYFRNLMILRRTG